MMLQNHQIVPQTLSHMSKTGLRIPLDAQHTKVQTMLSPVNKELLLFIKVTEPNLLVLHINDHETAIFHISGLEKEGQVTSQKSSQTSIILLFIVTIHCSESIKPKPFSLHTYLQNHHYRCLLDWLWTLQTWLHRSHSLWALCSVLPSLPPEGKQSQWHINRVYCGDLECYWKC